MSRNAVRKPNITALRNVAASRIREARRVLQAAKESLDNVAKATNVELIAAVENDTESSATPASVSIRTSS